MLQGRAQMLDMAQVVFQRGLAARGDEDDLFNAGGPRLFDRVLGQGTIYQWQQFLRDRLGHRKESRAQLQHGEDGCGQFCGVWSCQRPRK